MAAFFATCTEHSLRTFAAPALQPPYRVEKCSHIANVSPSRSCYRSDVPRELVLEPNSSRKNGPLPRYNWTRCEGPGVPISLAVERKNHDESFRLDDVEAGRPAMLSVLSCVLNGDIGRLIFVSVHPSPSELLWLFLRIFFPPALVR